MKLSRVGIPSLRPFLFLIASTIWFALAPTSRGSPLIYSQWSKTHWGKALPDVAALKVWVKPKDSPTGRYAFMFTSGVPAIGSSLITIPLLWVKVW